MVPMRMVPAWPAANFSDVGMFPAAEDGPDAAEPPAEAW